MICDDTVVGGGDGYLVLAESNRSIYLVLVSALQTKEAPTMIYYEGRKEGTRARAIALVGDY